MDIGSAHEIADDGCEVMDRVFVCLKAQRNIVLEHLETAFEVRDGHAGMGISDIHAHEIAGFGVESVDRRPTASGCAGFAKIYHEPFFHQLPYELGGRGHRRPDGLADSRYAVLSVLDAQIKYLLFQKGVLGIFFLQECLSHSQYFINCAKIRKIF